MNIMSRKTRRSFILGGTAGFASMLLPSIMKAEVSETTITIPQAREFYRAYSNSGFRPKDARSFLKSKGYPGKDSREIKSRDYADCMKWAGTPKYNQ